MAGAVRITSWMEELGESFVLVISVLSSDGTGHLLGGKCVWVLDVRVLCTASIFYV